MRTRVLAFVVLLSGCAYHPRPIRPATHPALIVVVTVENLGAADLERFTAEPTGAFARFQRRGAVFTQAAQDHGITDAAQGLAAVLSGRYPRTTMIVHDDSTTVADSSGIGPHRHRGTALFDWIVAQRPRARLLSVAGTAAGAILPVGVRHTGAGVYWYDPASGGFTTSTYYEDTLAAWVSWFNAAMAPARDPGLVWDPLFDPDTYPEPDSVPTENGGEDPTFPHALYQDTTVDAARLLEMPWLDSLTLAAALEGARQTRLGRGTGPDVLAVTLSASDRIAHRFGPESREWHDYVLRLDRWLAAFLDGLELLVPVERMAVAVTATHGMTPLPEYTLSRDSAAGYVPVDSVLAVVADSIGARIGPGRWVPGRDRGLVTFDRAAMEARGINNVDSVIDGAAEALRALPGVAQVDTRATLAAADTSFDVTARRWLHAVPDGTPRELFITLAPPNYFGSGARYADHGQATDLDARVPLLIMATGIRPGRYTHAVAVVDLAPTLAALAGLRPLGAVDGRVLREALR